MFSSAYTSTSAKSPTIEDWAKKVTKLEDTVQPAINDMQYRLGMGTAPIILKNKELELASQGAMMRDTYTSLSEATNDLKKYGSIKIIPYVSPLYTNKMDEEEQKKKSTKPNQMVSKPSGNDFLEGE